jgi:hypothetical protein
MESVGCSKPATKLADVHGEPADVLFQPSLIYFIICMYVSSTDHYSWEYI